MLPLIENGSELGRNPFLEGIRAWLDGLHWSDCPYPPGTYRRSDWLDGWDEEETNANHRKRRA